MISNPCRWCNSSNSEKEFIYEGGDKIFHFCPSEPALLSKLDRWVPINLIFFANDELHARDIVARMLQFRIDINKEYHSSHPEIAERNEYDLSLVKELLQIRDKWRFIEAPKNQFYKVGWASNDTIL